MAREEPDLVTMAANLRSGRLELEAYLDAVCEQVDESDRDIQAFVPDPNRRTRLQADALIALRRWPDPADRPALFGIPVAIKDVIHVDGLPTRAGSKVPATALAGAEATLVRRLRGAGALIAGKSVTAEFASTAPGPTRNPRYLGHTPGGSSSGSAAAVAAGLVPLAIGTQTIGSIIRPAAYCGIGGFKPSFGRIPIDGTIAHSPSFDTVGVFATSVAGLALAAGVLCDRWHPTPRTPASAPQAPPILGVPVGPYLEQPGAEATEAFATRVDLLSQAGFQVRPLPLLDDLADITVHSFIVNRYELAQTHKNWFATYADSYQDETARAIRDGQAIRRADYVAAQHQCQTFRRHLSERLETARIDALIAPAALGPPPLGLTSTGDARMSLPWTVAGLPILSLPADTTANGLPIGLQIIGSAHTDERLIELGELIAATLVSPRHHQHHGTHTG